MLKSHENISKEINNLVLDSTPCTHSNVALPGRRKVFYISDLHCDTKAQKGFTDFSDKEYINHVIAKMNGDDSFGDNPLIIVGDIDCYIENVDYFFSQLRMRRDGIIIFILGNHEIWACDMPTSDLDGIIEKYRSVCKKHDVIMLQNELSFFYDERTGNGDLLPFCHHQVISENKLSGLSIDDIQVYAEKAKMIIFGGLGSSEKTEKAYLKVSEALSNYNVIIATHFPFGSWSVSDYNPNFIYLSGHTHHNTYHMSSNKTIFADNQVGYFSDDYDLRCFLIDGTYDSFINYPDGIYNITHEQYIDFNIGKNVRLKKKKDGKQIILLKKGFAHMFVYYNNNNQLMLLNGGSPKRLYHDLNYYYINLDKYVSNIKIIMSSYMDRLFDVSKVIRLIGGDGCIHGCIIDIDDYNHIFINPLDGKITPYSAYDMKYKYVYKDLYSLLEEKKPSLFYKYIEWQRRNPNNELVIRSPKLTELSVLVTDKSIYKASKIVKSIQYLLFQDIVRDWNDKILHLNNKKEALEEIEKLKIDNSIYQSILT